jgi:succinyl-diaminopimelate desuccinylase
MISPQSVRRVLEAVDPDELIRLTADLVRINSVWDPEAGTSEQPVAEMVARWADEEGFQVSLEHVAPGRPNVVIRWQFGEGSRTLMFEGHTDVVTPGDLSDWNYDPFSAQIVGRRMHGRGTNDTKGNLAAMLIAMKTLKRSGIALSGAAVAGVLCDEEDQMLGVRHFIAHGHADGVTAAVICEPQNGMICVSQKGAIRARYTVLGRMSHGAMPLSGLNTAGAVARLIDGLHRIEYSAVKALGRDPLLGWPSFTPTVIRAPASGPPQLNVMPGKAEILVDVRTVTGQHHDDVRKEMTGLARWVENEVSSHYESYDASLDLERSRAIKVEVAFLADRPCTYTDKQEPIVKSAAWATQEILKREPVFGGVPGATDGTFLWSLKGIPIVTMGAGDRQVPHQVDEWVDLDQLIETAKIYALTALRYLYPEDPVGADSSAKPKQP